MNKQGKDSNSAMKKPLILAIETSGRNGSVALAIGEKMLAQTVFSAPMKHNAEIFPAASELLSRFSRKPQEIEQVYISAGPGSFTGLRIAVTLAKMMHLANNVKVVAVDTLDVIAANITANEPEIADLDKFAIILDAKRGQFFTAVWQSTNNPSTLLRAGKQPILRPSASEGRQTTLRLPRQKLGTGLLRPGQASNKIWEKILPDCLMTAADFVAGFADSSEPLGICGEGLVYYKDSFQADGIFVLDERFWSPDAEKVHFLGWQRALAGEFTNAAGLKPNYLRGDGAKVKRIS